MTETEKLYRMIALARFEKKNEDRALRINRVYEHDFVSFTVANRQVAIGGYMGKEPGDITPKFDFVEEKIG